MTQAWKASVAIVACLLVAVMVGVSLSAQQPPPQGTNGLGLSMGTLSKLSHAKTRSISPENFTGEKGRGGMAVEGTGAQAARDLGRGWKVSPSVKIKAGTTFTLGEITGSGAIQHIWMTPTGHRRYSILRIYWDGETTPSVEVPVGDFFAAAWGGYAQLSSLAVCVNPGSGLNAYWEMPFRKHCRITVENLAVESMVLYYQVNYTLTEIPDDVAYFHAQWRRSMPPSCRRSKTTAMGRAISTPSPR